MTRLPPRLPRTSSPLPPRKAPPSSPVPPPVCCPCCCVHPQDLRLSGPHPRGSPTPH